jgi:ring-1,2-phenylacetyl-CoA epoxidase subunit PaaE
MAPQGRFFVTLDREARRHHVGIAGGSGITPILSILKTVLVREPLSRFSLIYGNRQLSSAMFKEEIEDLKNRFLSRLAVHHVFSDQPTEAPIHMGLLDRAKVGEFLRTLVPAGQIDQAYICGPFNMNDEAEAALLAAGVAAERVHVERFGLAPAVMAPGSAAPAGGQTAGITALGATATGATAMADAVLHEAHAGDAEQSAVVVIRDGMQRELVYRKGQPSLLDSAAASGLELPFSCTSGVCGTCRARVIEGAVRMDRNFALDAKEVAAGFILTCQAHPVTDRVVLSFDER